MQLTIFAIALGVAALVEHAGHPKTGIAIMTAACWDAFLREWWNQSGHWSRVVWYRAWASVTLIVLASLALSARAGDNYKWHRAAKVERPVVTVHIVERDELAALALRHAPKAVRNACQRELHCLLSQEAPEKGLAILRHNTKTGAYVCDVYLLSAKDTATHTHELRHCHGWAHDL